ncbi:MAG: LuxR C-terminal-related transcriptional regulator [Caldilineaceae bacterium]
MHTKLQRPRQPRGTVARPHLWVKLDRGLDKPLILIAAGAGFGKTTLASSWLEELAKRTPVAAPLAASFAEPLAVPVAAPLTTAWLTLDEHDGDLVLFLRYFVAAVHKAQAGACPQTEAMLYAQRQPRPDLLLTTLSNELSQLPSDLLLVLDDYSAIQSEAVDEFLAGLLRSWPQPLHLVLITRYDPPLALPALRAKGAIVEVRSSDLRFSPSEATLYLHQAVVNPLDDRTIAAVQERAEGWIVGIKLASLSLDTGTSKADLVATLASSDVDATEYLAAEVFSHQPPAIQAFLLQTSILDHFCAALCAAVIQDAALDGGDAGGWSATACIEWLVRSNLFMIALDGQRKWYRYHHLFRDMLRRRALGELAEEQRRHLQQRAARWFAERHFFDEALRHALAAGDIDLAIQVVEEGLPDALNREDWLTLERWLRLLPPALVETRPWLLMLKAWILQYSWQLDVQLRVLDQIDALLDQSPAEQSSDMQTAGSGARLRALVAILRGQHAFYNNQPQAGLELLTTAFPSVPESWTGIRGFAMLHIGICMQAVGQEAAAERLLLDRFEQYEKKGDTFGLLLLMSLAFNYFAEGKLEQVRQTAATMLRLCADQPLANTRSWANYFMGAAYYEWNQPAAAEAHFAAVAERRYVATLVVVRDALHQLALLQQRRGRPDEARRTLEMLSDLELEQYGREDETTRGLRARLLLMEGDIDGAGRWADAFAAPVPDMPLVWLAHPHLIKARILLERQYGTDLADARHLLESLLETDERTYDKWFNIEVLALLAVCQARQGCETAALQTLEQALELARPGGFVRAFVELGQTMQALLARLPKQDVGVQRLLAAFPGEATKIVRNGAEPVAADAPAAQAPLLPPLPAPVAGLVEQLTPRELQVLALLPEPLSSQELAAKLHVSHATLKRHMANIYGKLGVTRRWDAVAQAKALGMLSPN